MTTSNPQKNPSYLNKTTLTKAQDSTLNKIPTRAINYINFLDAPTKFDSESKTGAAHGPARYEWGVKENILNSLNSGNLSSEKDVQLGLL